MKKGKKDKKRKRGRERRKEILFVVVLGWGLVLFMHAYVRLYKYSVC